MRVSSPVPNTLRFEIGPVIEDYHFQPEDKALPIIDVVQREAQKLARKYHLKGIVQKGQQPQLQAIAPLQALLQGQKLEQGQRMMLVGWQARSEARRQVHALWQELEQEMAQDDVLAGGTDTEQSSD